MEKQMKELDDIQKISQIDKSNLKQLLFDFPEQCREAKEIGKGTDFPSGYREINNIVFTGLGGSAVGGDLLCSYLANEARVPMVVNRNYSIPEFVDSNTLLVVCSYSGNTEETISAFEKGLKKKAEIVVITSGGKLKTAAVEHNLPLVTIPAGLPPRAALAYSFFPALMVLAKLGIIKDKSSQIENVALVLSGLRQRLNPEVKTKDNQAKSIACDIQQGFPHIYSSSDFFGPVSYRWRTQLAENSKSLSSNHVFPELTHNEIVGWDFPKELLEYFTVIILRDKGDNPRIAKRMDITASILKQNARSVIEVFSEGDELLSRIFSLIYIGDFVSFYLAILNGIDPTPVDRITYLKKKLTEAG